MDTNFLNDMEKRLFTWVEMAHDNQKRKYTNDPYVIHVLEVAKLIHDDPEIYNKRIVIPIALCHDILEDTEIDYISLFGLLCSLGYFNTESGDIVSSVQYLTKKYTKESYPDLNRLQRSIKEAERIAKCDFVTQSVKYADIISNVSTIRERNPVFSGKYLEEKLTTLLVAKGGSQFLYDKAMSLVTGEKL